MKCSIKVRWKPVTKPRWKPALEDSVKVQLEVQFNVWFNVQRWERRLEDFIHFLFICYLFSYSFLHALELRGSQEVLARGRQDGARLACKRGIPLLLYELLYCRNVGVLAPGTLESTGTQHSLWHVRILCRTTSMYIDPGFAQLLA